MLIANLDRSVHLIEEYLVILVKKNVYGKCSKILNTFHHLFSNKMWVIRGGIHQILVRIANREDTDQTASSEAV